jgi:pyruvate,water dikinase
LSGGAAGTIFEGLGVAAGQAQGPARVVLHPRDGHRLLKGEVLVAPTTDPAWTPLFLRAAGLVMETGGYLSHGAIVAREYGIPAVANTPGILDAVVDGDDLTVDGDAGRVVKR